MSLGKKLLKNIVRGTVGGGGARRKWKCRQPASAPLPTMLSTLVKTVCSLKLSPANTFTFDKAKIILSRKRVNFLPNNKILDVTQFKAFADDK